MVTADHDRRRNFASPNELVHRNAELRAFTVAKPADTRRQTLEMDPLLRQLHPAGEDLILREKLERELVGARDVVRITAQSNPAEGTFPFAEERPDVFRDETGNVEGVLAAGFPGLSANVVTVIEGDRAFLLQSEHGLDMLRHRGHRAPDILVGIIDP